MAGSIGVEHVVAILKAGKSAGRGCSLLIGAGCSITANIPSAARFVDNIKQEIEPHYLSAKEKTYPACM